MGTNTGGGGQQQQGDETPPRPTTSEGEAGDAGQTLSKLEEELAKLRARSAPARPDEERISMRLDGSAAGSVPGIQDSELRASSFR